MKSIVCPHHSLSTIRYPLFAILLILCLVGCRSTKKVTEGSQHPTQQPSVQQPEPERFLTGTFDCEILGFNVNGLLRMQYDSAIWINANKIIELGRAMCTPDSVFIYVKLKNTYFKGTYDDVNRLIGYKTDFKTLQKMIDDTYQAQKKSLSVKINSRIYKGTVVAKFRKLEASGRLKFPMAIPANAKPLNP